MTATEGYYVDPTPNPVPGLVAQMVAEVSHDLEGRDDVSYQAAIDETLDALKPIVVEMVAAVGAPRARGLLQQMFEVETDREKTSALFAAALTRLVVRL